MKKPHNDKLLRYQSILFNKSLPERIIELSQTSDKPNISQSTLHNRSQITQQQEILTLDKQFNINTYIFNQHENSSPGINFNKKCKQIFSSYVGNQISDNLELNEQRDSILYPINKTQHFLQVQTIGVQVHHSLLSTTRVVNGPIWAIETSQQRNYLAVAGRDMIVHVYMVQFQSNTVNSNQSESENQILDFPQKKSKYKRKKCNIQQQLSQQQSEDSCECKFILKSIRNFYGHSGEVLGLQFNKCNQILSYSTDNTVRIWSIIQYKCLGTIKLPETIIYAQWDSGDENLIYTLCLTKLYKQNIFTQKQMILYLQNDNKSRIYFKLLQNANYIYLLSQYNITVVSKSTFKIIESNLNVNSYRGKFSTPQHILSANVSENGQLLAFITADNRIRIYDANTFTQIYKIRNVNTSNLSHQHNIFITTKPGNDQKSQSPKIKQNKLGIIEINVNRQTLIYLSSQNSFSFSKIENTNTVQKKHIFSVFKKKILNPLKKKEYSKQNEIEEFQCVDGNEIKQCDYLKQVNDEQNSNLFGQYISKNIPQLQENITCYTQYQISQIHCFSQEINKIENLHNSRYYCILGDYSGQLYIYKFQ